MKSRLFRWTGIPCRKANNQEAGYETRQVIDVDITTVVTEWRAEVLEDSQGKRYVAPFPDSGDTISN